MVSIQSARNVPKSIKNDIIRKTRNMLTRRILSIIKSTKSRCLSIRNNGGMITENRYPREGKNTPEHIKMRKQHMTSYIVARTGIGYEKTIKFTMQTTKFA